MPRAHSHSRPIIAPLLAAAALIGALAGCSSEPEAPAYTPAAQTETPAPDVTTLAVLGDSMSLAVNACADRGVCTDASWVAGTEEAVGSLASRIASVQGERPQVALAAVDGGRVADAVGKLEEVIAADPQVVTVLIGANDACTATIAEQTSVDAYRAGLQTIVDTLGTRLPDTKVIMLSVPNLELLWEASARSDAAVAAWAQSHACESLLSNPTSLEQADIDRRQAVTDRVVAFNEVITEVCGPAANCYDDAGALFSLAFALDDISQLDYFHPSALGQAKIAQVGWNVYRSAHAG